MTEKPAGSLGRIFDVIDLISTELPLIRAEDVMERLGYSKSTSYRYLKTLCEVGLLAQAGGGLWSLGPRVVELERLMYLTDPLLQAGQRHMAALAPTNPNSVLLLSSLYRYRVLCVHKEGAETIAARGRAIRLLRARGLPLPLFQGAASLAVLAFLPARRTRALHQAHQAEIAAAGLGADWPAFRSGLGAMRRDGHVVTIGQLVLSCLAPSARLLASVPRVGSGPTGVGIGDGLCGLQLRGGDGAYGPRLPPVPVPGVRQAVQRAQRGRPEPDPVPL